MKKLLGICTAIVAGLLVFAFVTDSTQANKQLFQKDSKDSLDRAKQISLNILKERASLRGIGDVDEYKVTRVEIDDLNMAHTRVRQVIGKVPVWQGEAIVHLKNDCELFTVTDDLKEGIAINTEPNLSAAEATKIALNLYDGSKFLTAKPVTDL